MVGACGTHRGEEKLDGRGMWHTWRGREMRWSGHVAHIEGKRNAYTIFIGKHETKRWLGRTRH